MNDKFLSLAHILQHSSFTKYVDSGMMCVSFAQRPNHQGHQGLSRWFCQGHDGGVAHVVALRRSESVGLRGRLR